MTRSLVGHGEGAHIVLTPHDVVDDTSAEAVIEPIHEIGYTTELGARSLLSKRNLPQERDVIRPSWMLKVLVLAMFIPSDISAQERDVSGAAVYEQNGMLFYRAVDSFGACKTMDLGWFPIAEVISKSKVSTCTLPGGRTVDVWTIRVKSSTPVSKLPDGASGAAASAPGVELSSLFGAIGRFIERITPRDKPRERREHSGGSLVPHPGYPGVFERRIDVTADAPRCFDIVSIPKGETYGIELVGRWKNGDVSRFYGGASFRLRVQAYRGDRPRAMDDKDGGAGMHMITAVSDTLIVCSLVSDPEPFDNYHDPDAPLRAIVVTPAAVQRP